MSATERPILFSSEMVRAILEGRKTQTRRMMNPQPSEGWTPHSWGEVRKMKDGDFVMRRGAPVVIGYGPSNYDGTEAHACKYCATGAPDDRLWVRETFTAGNMGEVYYRATGGLPPERKWCPSIHMPRWASRITLEIVSVKVERLQEISDADAIAEGVTIKQDAKITSHFIKGEQTPAQLEYYALWESINGKGSWAENPFVWAITFKRTDP